MRPHRMIARVLPVVLAAAMVTVTAQNAIAAGGPSVPLPPVGSTPVTQQTMGPRGSDPASDAALKGDQGAKNAPDGGGNAKASPLSPSATWSVSGQSGDFTWSYPLRVPPAPGGFTPKLGLAYSSSAVDGRTSAANNQASWVGDGWDLSVGFIERSYMPCASDDMGGTTPSDKMGDLCWRSDNATASYGSKASELILDDNGRGWHPRADDGSKVDKLTGSGNGARNGEYWRITTVDGTQYLYGSRPDSSSTWTVPVYGDDDNEPCHQDTFEASSCTQAWRWNLDKVIDRNGNVILYNYAKETNSYGPANKDAAVSYVRGGTLTSAEYGMGTDSTQATGRVEFTTADRCVPGSVCTKDKKDNWPDVPWDDNCDTATCVDKHSPTFWSTKRLTTVTTKVWSGSAWKDVESWSLDQQFPDPGDGEKAALWLKGITHKGLGATPVSLPAVTFEGAKFPNRVVLQDGIGPLNRYRITAVLSETGGVTSVNYATPECTATHLPDKNHAELNSMRCYPQTWAKRDYAEQTDFFQKYVVESVVQSDRISANPEVQTSYEYLDGAAWAYDTSEFTKEKNRTWNEFRGFDKVRVRTGQANDPSGPVTMVEQRFYRGMNGDHMPTGTRPVQISDSAGGWRDDNEWLRGTTYETQTHDGTSDNVVTKTITTPKVQGPTADRAGRKAYMVTPGLSVTYAAKNAGGWRTTKTDQSYDSYGQLIQTNDLGDIATAADDQCTTVTYNRNSDAYLKALQATTETVGKACGTAPTFPGDAIAASRFAYDTKDFDGKPTSGNVTRTEVLDQRPAGSTKPVYSLGSTSGYDHYGRVTSTTDANNNTTLTAYTQDNGGPVTATTVTNAKQQVTKTTVETAYGQPVMVTDPNGRNTVTSYDALGRKTAVWLANRDPATQSPNQKFAYAYHTDAPTVVTISALGPNGNYTTSNQLYDGLLRVRQVQQPAPGGGRLLIDTRYDTQGRQYRTTKPYFNDAPVDDKLWVASDAAVASQTVTQYDGAGRTVANIVKGGVAELWRTSTTYDADRTNVTPPPGGTATTTISNVRGQTTELRQYHGPKPEGDDYDSTTYQYTPAGDLAVLTDPVGTVWKRGYDLHRRKIRDEDPDKGVSTMTYDAVGNLATATDSKNDTLAYEYDSLNRKIAMHSGSKTGPLLADWTYDTVLFAKGQLASANRYTDGKTYKTQVLGYSALYQVTGKAVTIPDAGLNKTYTTYSTYNWDGSVSGATYAPIGTLGAETLTYGRNDLGAPTTLTGSVKLVSEVDYTRYAEIERLQLGSGTQRVWVSRYYDDHTRRLKRSIVDAEVSAPMQADYNYTYDPAGNVLSVANTPLGQNADTQCVRLDYLQRLTEAWTPAGSCDQQPDVTKLDGPAKYWQSFTYDKVGNRRTETQHSTAGDTVRTYTYPASNQNQPHTLTSVKTVSPAGESTDTFGYNTIGQTTTRKVGATQQTYEWDSEGHVSKITDGARSTTYVYDADGGRLLSKDDTGTTLYLGNEQLKLTTSGQLQPTRYYDMDGKTIAVRDGKGLSWVTSDEQGTAQISVNPGDNLAVTQRRQLPFGAPRGQAVDFPGQRGFVGGVTDTSIGTTHLGAREYDPSLGRFLSVDGLIDVSDAQQMQGYSYGDNNPLTKLDPSGLMWGWLSDTLHGIADFGHKMESVAAGAWDFFDKHSGTIGLILGVAGMVVGTSTGIGVAIFVAGLVVNAYDTAKSGANGDDVGFGLGMAGTVLGVGSRTVGMVGKWIKASAPTEAALEGAGKGQDLVGGALGSASAGMSEYGNTPKGRQEAEQKKQRQHVIDVANDIAAMKASQCPSLVGVLPIPGPCADSDISMADPMLNKYCGKGMDENILGCAVFGADNWNGRRAEKQGPQMCHAWCGWNGWGGWGRSQPPAPKPRQSGPDPYPQYSGYHPQSYLDMKYR